MEQTTNYQLSQWDEKDRILREDFNADNAKTEQALAEHEEVQNGLQAALANCGNCRIVATTYTGTGSSGSDGPCRLTFEQKPLLVMISNPEGQLMVIHRGSTLARSIGGTYTCPVTWSGNTVSWYHAQSNISQFNSRDVTYYVFTLFKTQ